VTHLTVPPGKTKFEMVLTYQYFGSLHGVSHSQLSLIGWGTNGLWEEVGLGSSGEAITYEPHGHQRRQTALDTRGFLVCGKDDAVGCEGSPDSTRWTDNVGGADFLNAVDQDGQYQYLVEDKIFHTMNGPRLTNATYEGTTVDGFIKVQRRGSSFSVCISEKVVPESFSITFATLMCSPSNCVCISLMTWPITFTLFVTTFLRVFPATTMLDLLCTHLAVTTTTMSNIPYLHTDQDAWNSTVSMTLRLYTTGFQALHTINLTFTSTPLPDVEEMHP
jgi:hypothetical protein